MNGHRTCNGIAARGSVRQRDVLLCANKPHACRYGDGRNEGISGDLFACQSKKLKFMAWVR